MNPYSQNYMANYILKNPIRKNQMECWSKQNGDTDLDPRAASSGQCLAIGACAERPLLSLGDVQSFVEIPSQSLRFGSEGCGSRVTDIRPNGLFMAFMSGSLVSNYRPGHARLCRRIF
ncbi:hypothetical protein CJ030_MR7G009302 [Morella rubra]|uniref:Uncharacterized protein n=1 Tax=Morella rubra TaxID=262757 RepID=A0A6A1V0A8_9ROSI|nr:hypothetical protein CJ030_MR7G009302 [Morella rubra]